MVGARRNIPPPSARGGGGAGAKGAAAAAAAASGADAPLTPAVAAAIEAASGRSTSDVAALQVRLAAADAALAAGAAAPLATTTAAGRGRDAAAAATAAADAARTCFRFGGPLFDGHADAGGGERAAAVVMGDAPSARGAASPAGEAGLSLDSDLDGEMAWAGYTTPPQVAVRVTVADRRGGPFGPTRRSGTKYQVSDRES
ncbi:hypothetical protein BU14_0121s0029 [Porphyra umbilicalis]|uniref:Uncharacterized protein n=1 Tax=Porphyra umbilicalis TaxID=2786 RepID=A0A1X6PB41_PORUM|nr:hypothetical protein BU14_0121s0029 [Porphyra umbilicalis]|eukprot:OSX78101.1 hypothetical protein BU14_0121s0029 [Porphyra umbilicalis]